MKTWAAGENKARTLFHALPPEQQQALLDQCKQGKVMQFDSLGKEQEKVVGVFFGMDCCIGSRYIYLFSDDIQVNKKEHLDEHTSTDEFPV